MRVATLGWSGGPVRYFAIDFRAPGRHFLIEDITLTGVSANFQPVRLRPRYTAKGGGTSNTPFPGMEPIRWPVRTATWVVFDFGDAAEPLMLRDVYVTYRKFGMRKVAHLRVEYDVTPCPRYLPCTYP